MGQVVLECSSAHEADVRDRSDEEENACDVAGSTHIAPVTIATEGVTSVSSERGGNEAAHLAGSAEVVPESQVKRRSAKRGLSNTKLAQKTANDIAREVKRLRKEANKNAE